MLPGHAICTIVSDGAGSASHGGQGASLVCRCLTTSVRTWFDRYCVLPGDEQVKGWIDEVRDRLDTVAMKRSLTRRQFAATLAMLVLKDDQLLSIQIGDSAVVARRANTWEAICWPENGEFASTTFFVTDDPEVRLRTVRVPLEYDAFALFSDGIENLALDHIARQPHAPFFEPMMKPVDQSPETGKLPTLSSALGRYLDSRAVCELTDDDKTLILLSSV